MECDYNSNYVDGAYKMLVKPRTSPSEGLAVMPQF